MRMRRVLRVCHRTRINSLVGDVRFPCSGKACAGIAWHDWSNGPSSLLLVRTIGVSVVTFSCGQETSVETVKVVGVHDQLVVMIITKRLPTIAFSCAAVVLVVQSAIDSLSHFEKAQFASAPELKKVVCGRESIDMVIHLLWCSLLCLRAWMRHAFPIVPRFVPYSKVAKRSRSCLWYRVSGWSIISQCGQVFIRKKLASGYVNEHFEVLCTSGHSRTWIGAWMRMMLRALWMLGDGLGPEEFVATFCGA